MNKTYCPIPFTNISLQSDDITLPCCQFMDIKPFKPHIPIYEIINGEFMIDMRQRLLDGQPIDGCETCYDEESMGLISKRLGAINSIGYKTEFELSRIELFLDNVCNLKCRTCSSAHSHLLFSDEIKLYGTTFSPNKYLLNTTFKDLDLSKLTTIEILGGEPTISSNLEEFLTMLELKQRTHEVTISINTNGMLAPIGSLLKTLLNCKKLKLLISVDAPGNLNDYIRGESNFNSISKQLEFYNQLPNQRPENTTEIFVHSAVSIYNVNYLNDLQVWIKKHFTNIGTSFQLVQHPSWLSIANTPQDFKDIIRPTVKNEKIINYLDQHNDDLFAHFINYTEKLDSIRNENLETLNPLLYQYMNEYKNRVDVEVSQQFFSKMINQYKGIV